MKKIPERMCVITHNKMDKRDLLRIVKTPEGQIELDLTGKKNGKGAYITKSIEVLNQAKKSKVLDQVFATSIPDEIYNEIANLIK